MALWRLVDNFFPLSACGYVDMTELDTTGRDSSLKSGRTLYLIDAYAQIFRAYFAIRNGMHSPVTGEATHAVFGFAAMLFKLYQTKRPTYVLVAADAPGKTFRDAIFPEYKGTRNATPDDLSTQIPRIFQMLDAFGIPYISAPTFEADDVMASVTDAVLRDSACDDVSIRLVSKDKDLKQLLTDRCSLYDIHTDQEISPATLRADEGITPEQVIDYLTLTGDTADNIPGVEGIGPKTASALLREYGSLEGIYANLALLSAKRQECFTKARGHILQSRDLVTLRRDATPGFRLSCAEKRRFDGPALLELFRELGFNRFQEEAVRLIESFGETLVGSVAAEVSAPVTETTGTDGAYEIIEHGARALEAMVALAGATRVSLEIDGADHAKEFRGVALTATPGSGFYLRVCNTLPFPDVLNAIRSILEDENVAKCGLLLKRQAKALLRHGVTLRGVDFDAHIAQQLLEPETAFDLDAVSLAILGRRLMPSEKDDSADAAARRSMERTDIVLELQSSMTRRLRVAGMETLLTAVEAPLGPILAEMEFRGIKCDPEELRAQGVALGERLEAIKGAIWEAAGFRFDLNSTKQVAETLYVRMGLPTGRKTKTGWSTDSEELERLALEADARDVRTQVPKMMLEYRMLSKLISTYLNNLIEAIDPKTGRIHSVFHSMATATGRMASHGPNLQNIPVKSADGRQIRKAFVAEPGNVLIGLDYSQIELRVLAHLSGDAALIAAFERNDDIHAAVASEVFGTPIEEVTREQRNQAKTINFGIVYGVTAYGLAHRISALDVSAAANLIEDYGRRYRGVSTFLQECYERACRDGYVSTLMGRRRPIPNAGVGAYSHRALASRLAINTVVQGSAADLIKAAMVAAVRRIQSDQMPVSLLLQIHDELVFESSADGAADYADRLKREMETALPLRVPLRVESNVGMNWMATK
jgi:DNA polymerase-1